jgi:hypothetical protein
MVWRGRNPFQKYFPLSSRERGIKGERSINNKSLGNRNRLHILRTNR